MPRAVCATEKQPSNQARERVKNQASRPKSQGGTTAKAARKNEQTGTRIIKKKVINFSGVLVSALVRRGRRMGVSSVASSRVSKSTGCVNPANVSAMKRKKSAIHIRPASPMRGVSSRQNGSLMCWTRRSIDQNADQRHPLMVNQ